MGVVQKILMAILRPFAALFFGIFRMALFVLVLLIAAVVFWRGAVEGMVTQTLSGLIGVPVVVEGGVDFTGDNGAGVLVSGIVADNPDWAVRDHLLKIETLSARFNPVAAFFGRAQLHELTVNGFALSLERGAGGAPGLANYTPAAVALAKRHASPHALNTLRVDAFKIQDATVFLRDGENALELDIPHATGRYNPPGAPGGLSLDSVSVFARGSEIAASLLIEPGPAQPRISGRVNATRLDLARLVPHHPAPPQVVEDGRDGAPDAPDTLDTFNPQALAAFLSRHAPLFNHMDVNIRLDVRDLRLPGMVAADLSLVLWRQGDGALEVRNLSAETP